MKYLFTFAFLFLATFNQAKAYDLEKPFVLAMDYSILMHLAQNDTFYEAKEMLKEDPKIEKKDPLMIPDPQEDDSEKWEPVKDLKSKPRSFSGEASFDANDNVSIGAAAGYTFPEQTEQNKIDKAYSLKINLEMAL